MHDYHDVFFLNVSEQLASQFKDWLMTVDGGLKSEASASESRQQLFFILGCLSYDVSKLYDIDAVKRQYLNKHEGEVSAGSSIFDM